MTDEILEGFEDYLLVDMALSAKTSEVYLQVAKDYLDFIGTREEDDIETLKSFYFSKELNSRTISKYRSALNNYFTYRLRNKEIVQNPQEYLDRIKIEKKLVHSISDSQVKELLDNTKGDLSLRDRAIFATMYRAGARVSELVGIKISDVDFQTGFVKLKGKRNKERLVPLSAETLKLIERYIKEDRINYDKYNSNYLFLSIRGKNLTRNEIWHRIKACSKDLDFSLTPHTLRHSFATTLLENDAPLNCIRDMLGHSSISTTQVYTQINDKAVKREYFRVFDNLF